MAAIFDWFTRQDGFDLLVEGRPLKLLFQWIFRPLEFEKPQRELKYRLHLESTLLCKERRGFQMLLMVLFLADFVTLFQRCNAEQDQPWTQTAFVAERAVTLRLTVTSIAACGASSVTTPEINKRMLKTFQFGRLLALPGSCMEVMDVTRSLDKICVVFVGESACGSMLDYPYYTFLLRIW
eukprot:CAMPEP_0184302446 /NCGR_PEP_ID=MMETSP1049-20130417/12423_1 /TAXON_ID=77928 /ORGANISM="Proteomonas sulcata, Strain CCMP704" /LENGTH=180 /DNA_ID=CAMNT_0026613743 /DNA_START=262 /DNA_END=801 /DNA_ORIENTATION=+